MRRVRKTRVGFKGTIFAGVHEYVIENRLKANIVFSAVQSRTSLENNDFCTVFHHNAFTVVDSHNFRRIFAARFITSLWRKSK